MSKHKGMGLVREGYRPEWEDYFPRLVRGHSLGTRLWTVRDHRTGKLGRRTTAARCADEGCHYSKKGGTAHQDRQRNIDQWREDRG